MYITLIIIYQTNDNTYDSHNINNRLTVIGICVPFGHTAARPFACTIYILTIRQQIVIKNRIFFKQLNAFILL